MEDEEDMLADISAAIELPSVLRPYLRAKFSPAVRGHPRAFLYENRVKIIEIFEKEQEKCPHIGAIIKHSVPCLYCVPGSFIRVGSIWLPKEELADGVVPCVSLIPRFELRIASETIRASTLGKKTDFKVRFSCPVHAAQVLHKISVLQRGNRI